MNASPSPLLPTTPVHGLATLRTLRSLYIAAWQEMVRDFTTLFWVFGFPVVMLVLFGVLLGNHSGPSYTIGVVQNGHGSVAQSIISTLRSVPGFTVRMGNEQSLRSSMRGGDIDGIIVLPAALTLPLTHPVAMTLIVDPAQQTSSGILESVVAQIADQIDRAIHHNPQEIVVQTLPISGHVLSGFDYLLPGLLTMALIQLGLFGTSIPIIQMRQSGVLRQLSATPISRSALAASQIIFRLTLAVAQLGVFLVLGALAFHISLGSHILAMLGIALLGTLMFIALGYALASRARTVESATGLIQMVFMPMMFLSGLFFPLSLFPSWLRFATYIVPSTYLADGLRQTLVDATPYLPLGLDIAAIAAWLIVFAGGAIALFRWA